MLDKMTSVFISRRTFSLFSLYLIIGLTMQQFSKTLSR